MSIKRVGILTGGGDCPGLNAVMRGIVKTGIRKFGFEFVGIKNGYKGLYNDEMIPLTWENTSGILHKGGTILYSSNKDNLFQYPMEENGGIVYKDVSDVGVKNLKKNKIDALIVIGGDGTLTSARDFGRKGVNVIGVPKTIDNDLSGTDTTFGFDTAVNVATDAIDRLHTTAESHHRIMVVEVMGRYAGFIALHAGISGGADIILIPEIPYDTKFIANKIKERVNSGKTFSLLVVAEGAKCKDGDVMVFKTVKDSPDPVRLGGIAYKLADELEKLVKFETRATILGHVQRGGTPSPCDRLLSTRYGVKAAEMVHEGDFGSMAAIKGNVMTSVPLEKVIGANKSVDPDGELVQVARSVGITFGDK